MYFTHDISNTRRREVLVRPGRSFNKGILTSNLPGNRLRYSSENSRDAIISFTHHVRSDINLKVCPTLYRHDAFLSTRLTEWNGSTTVPVMCTFCRNTGSDIHPSVSRIASSRDNTLDLSFSTALKSYVGPLLDSLAPQNTTGGIAEDHGSESMFQIIGCERANRRPQDGIMCKAFTRELTPGNERGIVTLPVPCSIESHVDRTRPAISASLFQRGEKKVARGTLSHAGKVGFHRHNRKTHPYAILRSVLRCGAGERRLVRTSLCGS